VPALRRAGRGGQHNAHRGGEGRRGRRGQQRGAAVAPLLGRVQGRQGHNAGAAARPAWSSFCFLAAAGASPPACGGVCSPGRRTVGSCPASGSGAHAAPATAVCIPSPARPGGRINGVPALAHPSLVRSPPPTSSCPGEGRACRAAAARGLGQAAALRPRRQQRRRVRAGAGGGAEAGRRQQARARLCAEPAAAAYRGTVQRGP
jgi:hypothetical protein